MGRNLPGESSKDLCDHDAFLALLRQANATAEEAAARQSQQGNQVNPPLPVEWASSNTNQNGVANSAPQPANNLTKQKVYQILEAAINIINEDVEGDDDRASNDRKQPRQDNNKG